MTMLQKRNLKEIKIGDKFNKLTVIDNALSYIWVNKKTKKQTHKKRFKCICDCGNVKITLANNLKNNKVRSCSSCMYKARPQSLRRRSFYERLFDLTIKSRKIEVNLTINEFKSIVIQNCYYCNSKGKQPEYLGKTKYCKYEIKAINGIDRVNSNLGYTLDNCVPCCTKCNIAKNTLSQKEFLDHIEKIYLYQNQKIEKG